MAQWNELMTQHQIPHTLEHFPGSDTKGTLRVSIVSSIYLFFALFLKFSLELSLRPCIGKTDAEGEAPTLWPPDAKR